MQVLVGAVAHCTRVWRSCTCVQVIQVSDAIFQRAQLPLRLRPFSVLITGADAGIIETVHDARSVHRIKVGSLWKGAPLAPAQVRACVAAVVGCDPWWRGGEEEQALLSWLWK